MLVLVAWTSQAQIRGGDTWGVVRGDNSPGFAYSTFVETPSGRWLAAGPSGALMFSDDQGAEWRYSVITDQSGKPLFGNIADIVVHGGQLVATLVSFELSEGQNGRGGPPLPFVGRTRILTSSDNGDSWSVAEFPIERAVFGGTLTGVSLPGIFLPHLFVTPGGDLLAYGTTAQSTGAHAFFIGGAIFRQIGSTWEQVAFELGVLQSMALGGSGELVASGFRTLLESEDGLFWNGHSMVDANFSIDGTPLDSGEKELLNGSDITFINGQYVMQTQEFRRSRNNPNIVVAANQRSVIYQSADPFAPSRNWTGTQVNRIWPEWLNMGSNLLSVVDAAWSSSNGVNWTNRDASVTPLALSIGRVGAQGVVAVGSGDEVWTSGDSGQSWSKILDQAPGPDVFILGKAGDVLLAVGRSQTSARDSLYRSVDNGQTWIETLELDDVSALGGIGFPVTGSGRTYVNAGFSDRIITSDDTGLSWSEIPIPTTSTRGLENVTIGSGGRLIVPQATFSPNIHVSDDGGDSWVTRPSPLAFEDDVKRGLHAGGGRIVYLLNSGSPSLNPRLLTSDDNGASWQIEDPFQELDELDSVFNDPDQRVINLRKIFRTTAGSLIILGDQGELLVSRDKGLSWEVKLFLERLEDDFLDWTISEVFESSGRLVAIAYRNSPNSSAFKTNFAYISEDDGDSWRPVEIPTNESRVAFQSGIVGAEGRMVITGNNGAVYISEPVLTESREFRVREAETLTIDVPPPPAAGDINVTYRLLSGSAVGDLDFVQTSGDLNWAEGDNTPRQVSVETIDDLFNEGDETLQVEFNLSGDLIYSWSYEVTIADDELMFALPTNVDIEVDGAVRTSEDGTSVEFGVALSRSPSQDVTLELSIDTEGEIAFAPASLTFTSANWKRVQPITVTGLDDDQLDGNRTVQLVFDTVSAGPEFDNLDPGVAYIVNEDNEDPNVIFNNGFESAP